MNEHRQHDHAPHDHAGHGHADHGHHHSHHHGPGRYDRAFAIGAALNGGFVIAEIVFGLAANSMALLSDAVHNLGDVLALLLAWGAAWLSRRPPSAYRTYGWGRSSVMAALVNAVVLLVGIGGIGVEAIRRLAAPEPVAEVTVMIVAAAGIAINGGTALLFLRGRAEDLNLRAQFLHLGGDALVSAGVVLAAFAVHLTGWFWLDPVTSLAIAAVIAVATWGLLCDSVDLAMDAVPGGVAHEDVRRFLAGLPGVAEVHDLHIWGLSTTQTALTAHLVYADGQEEQRRLHEVQAELHHRFGIGHATFQVESHAEAEECRLRPHCAA
jgi:cobalt-zinc-cadmium efflux system protein